MVDFAAHTARIINRLGQPVTLTPAGGPARVVNAVFSARPETVLLVGGYLPTLRVAAASAAGLKAGDAVAVGANNYTIADIDDDSLDSGDVVYQLQAA